MRNGTPGAIASRNQGSGFFGAVRAHAGPEEAWALALRSIANATGCSDEAVRVCLDSRYGRHFADDVLSDLQNDQELAGTIDRTVAQACVGTSNAYAAALHWIRAAKPRE